MLSFPANKQVKKLIVKDFRGQTLPANFEANSWEVLKAGISDIFNRRLEVHKLETLYRTCEDLCRCRMASSLYNRVSAEIEVHAQLYAKRLAQCVTAAKGKKEEELLEAVQGVWNDYMTSAKTVGNVLLYLDRVYVLGRNELVSIWNICMNQFRHHALSATPDAIQLRTQIIEAVSALVEHDRRTDMSDLASILSLTFGMFSSLRLMEDHLKPVLLESTDSFFSAKAQEKLIALPMDAYLNYVKQRVDSEKTRYEGYGFDAALSAELLRHCLHSLFVTPIDRILPASISQFVEQKDAANLQLLYSFCSKTCTISGLRDAWSKFIRDYGVSLLSLEGEREDQIIPKILEFRTNLTTLVDASLEKDVSFSDAIKDSFEHFLNVKPNRTAELLAKYADAQLRGGHGGSESSGSNAASNATATSAAASTTEELDQAMDNVISLFRPLQAKDIFESLFKKDLARRLLLSRSAGFESERRFVAQLKTECGSSYTSRMETMFKDVEVSRELMALFKESPQAPSNLNKDLFATNIISSGLWPYPPNIEVTVPEDVIAAQEAFAAFYQAKHKNRQVVWHQGMGNVVIKANFSQGSKELQVSIPQAVILAAFNDTTVPSLSFKDLQGITGMDVVNLTRALQSLACGKINILNKTPKGWDVTEHDVFTYNDSFTSKHHRIRINALPQRSDTSTPSSIASTSISALPMEDEQSHDRPYLVDAAIVRIMKKNTKMEQSDLMTAVQEELNSQKYSVTKSEFDTRLSAMLEREFITRDSKKSTSITYCP